MGSMISFDRAGGGGSVQGYLAEPAGGAAAPGVVVIQEWWGLQGQIKAMCDRLAADGFRALAPDLYGGKVVPYHDKKGAAESLSKVDLKQATSTIGRGAAQHLRAKSPKVGLTGFCAGGVVATLGAMTIPELAAVVTFYGLPPPQLGVKPEDVKVPLQGHFASRDDFCTPQLVDAYEAGLRAAGKPFEFHRYEADHAFLNSERKEVYDPAAAELAWKRCLDFFRRTLGG